MFLPVGMLESLDCFSILKTYIMMMMVVVVVAVVVAVTVIMITNHVVYSVGISNHIIPDIPAPRMLVPIHQNHSVHHYTRYAWLHLTQHKHVGALVGIVSVGICNTHVPPSFKA